jgi:hypothetical protein
VAHRVFLPEVLQVDEYGVKLTERKPQLASRYRTPTGVGFGSIAVSGCNAADHRWRGFCPADATLLGRAASRFRAWFR